jgi:hypothetical protein
MINIQEIVGEKSYARLLKAKIASEHMLNQLKPEEIMSIAGIGPKKMQKLMKALGRTASDKSIESTYGKLQFRRKFENVTAGIKKTIENPKPFIDKAEGWRRTAVDVHNFIKSVHNIGRPESDKLKDSIYTPVRFSLDPESLGYQGAQMRYTMTFRLDKREGKFIISYRIDNMEDGTSTLNEEPLEANLIGQEELKRFMEVLRVAHAKFREKSPNGIIVVLLYSNIDFIREAVEKKYKRELDNQLMAINTGEGEYLGYNVLFKYRENPDVQRMIERLAGYENFYQFEQSGLKDWEEFDIRRNEMIEKGQINGDFWEMTNESGTSYVQLTNGLIFGIIRAQQDLRDWVNDGYNESFKSSAYNVQFPESVKEFYALKTKRPVTILDKKIGMDVIGMVDYTLGDFKVYAKYGNPVIFVSNEFPEFGFVYRGGHHG